MTLKKHNSKLKLKTLKYTYHYTTVCIIAVRTLIIYSSFGN